MTVYVVVGETFYGGYTILGVYAKAEDAKERAQDDACYVNAEVETWKVSEGKKK